MMKKILTIIIIVAIAFLLKAMFNVQANKLSYNSVNVTLQNQTFQDLSQEKFYRFGIGAKMDEASTAKLAYTLKVDWIRLESAFIWGNVEPFKGNFNFNKTDNLVKEIEKYGIKMIGKFTSYAEWACGSKEVIRGHIPSPPGCKPDDVEEYKKFVKTVVERYDGDGINDMPGLKYPIKYWTIGNEVEDPTFFDGSGKDYAELLKASYEAIKEADPEARVLISAAGDVKLLEEPFWKEAFSQDIGNYFDYGNIHYNVGNSGIDEEGFEDLSRGFKYYEEFLNSYGIEGKKIFGTEISPAPGYLPKEEEAKLWVIGSVKSFYEGSAGIKYPFVFEDDEKMLRMFLTMVTLLRYFDEVEKINEGCYKFYINKSVVYVMWSSCDINLNGNVYVIDIYGNVKSSYPEFSLSNDVIYVTNDEGRVSLLEERMNSLEELKEKLKEFSVHKNNKKGKNSKKWKE